MDFNEYQEKVARTAVYPNVGANQLYPAIGLAGEVGETIDAFAFDTFGVLRSAMCIIALLTGLAKETGEVSEAVKKLHRDLNAIISDEKRDQIKKELGDVLWYVASLARECDIKLEDVAQANIDKLSRRLDNNTLHGSGNDR